MSNFGTGNFDFGESVKEATRELGHVNIAVVGKTGVGKSTLINAIFGEDLAKTGVGQPVTQECTMYTKEDSSYSILDTKGLELANYEEILNELKDEIRKRKGADAKTHIHVAWYCIHNMLGRIEDGEVNFINELAHEIPVIIVLTNALVEEDELYNQIVNLSTEAKQIVKVMALQRGTQSSYGLDTLISVTEEVLPEAAKNAFVAAQKVDMEMKRKAARKIIAAAVAAGVTACAVPLPFADSAALAPIEVVMLAKISRVMGLDVTKTFLSTLVSSSLGVLGATLAGRAIVTGLLKLIPGLGTAAGTAIGAATAATLITAIGEAYIAAIERLKLSGIADPQKLSEEFVSQLKRQKK